ncbi:MAG TPA: FtsX-like permease family protein, partial [Candidatus Synoicihabitans sp.]|nr:FtsX-like permease family protein [Candidatus Synoicihabitans sp.]
VLFGLVPAWQAARADLRDALAQGGRAGSARGGRVRAALIVGEFALTCVLLIGAGLMLRTLSNLHAADPGYSTERVVAFNWALPTEGYSEAAQRIAVVDRALERVRRLPGVVHTGLITPLLLTGGGHQSSYYVEGAPEPEVGRHPSTETFRIAGETLGLLEMPLIMGRTFDARDQAESPRVAIVDTRFVERNFGADVNPLGRRFAFGGTRPKDEKAFMEIVGVVPHIQNYGLGRDTREQVYLPYTQSTPSSMTFLLRTTQDSTAWGPILAQAMREVVPDLPVFGVLTMDELFQRSIGTQRLTVVLLGTFAGLALLLAAVGLYGVLSTTVGQRTREIGVRLALGATTRSVLALIVNHGLRLAALGIMIGAAVALAATKLLGSVLYGVSATDPITFAIVLLALLTIGVVSCWLPARRATRVDPMVALRAD